MKKNNSKIKLVVSIAITLICFNATIFASPSSSEANEEFLNINNSSREDETFSLPINESQSKSEATAKNEKQELLAVEDDDDYEELEVEPLTEFITSLDKSTYVGYYINSEGKTCLTTTNAAPVSRMLSRVKGLDSQDIIVESVQYSLDQLENVQDELLDDSSLNLNAIGIDTQINGLAIFVPTVTDEIKSNILNKSAIKNIVFYSTGNDPKSRQPITDDETQESSSLANKIYTGSVTGGYYLGRPKSWSSVGYRAIVANHKGFITCGHGWTNGQTAYYNGTALGNVTENQYKANSPADVCFIPSTASWTGLRDGSKIQYVGDAGIGDSIYWTGAASKKRNATVRALHVKGVTSDEADNKIPFTDCIAYDNQPLHGDSGAALVKVKSDGTKVLIGFNRSEWWKNNVITPPPLNFSWGLGSTWSNVKSYLDAQIIN